MFKWLLFNMGITRDARLTPLLQALHRPSTTVAADPEEIQYGLGLGWFIGREGDGRPASICKDGELDGFASYIAFLPSSDPGKIASQAGAFVLVNADGITKDGKDIALATTNDLLLCMQGEKPPADRSAYPRSARTIARRT